ncbi:NUDIX hydrolase [Ornithinimicrobium sp. W1665]|uniref:NUDIX hydrolase n=1 Tax=Ornithinimicrobium sp. W1665 TaxID=3416666 RepID=UPI003CF7D309
MTDVEDPRPYRDLPMPEVVEGHSRAWLATEPARRQVARPRPSATVMLLREASAGPGVEVFVLRRAATMAFAPGMVAFPGGGVDPRDADQDVPWAGPSPLRWAELLGTGEDVARELVTAAAREVFEECGVLLAGPGPHEVVADVAGPSWRQERQALLDRTQSFGELLARRGLVLRTDLMALRAHWTTPVCEPRRYDTRFFAARMPRGQRADGETTEAERSSWSAPAEVLQHQQVGREILLPPTQVMLEQLREVQDLDAWLAGPVAVHPVRPWPVEHDGRLWMRCPVDAAGHGVPAAVVP